jgi:hypothetical protein
MMRTLNSGHGAGREGQRKDTEDRWGDKVKGTMTFNDVSATGGLNESTILPVLQPCEQKPASSFYFYTGAVT